MFRKPKKKKVHVIHRILFHPHQLPVYALMSYMGILSRLAVCDAGYLVNFLRLAGQQIAPGTDFLDTFLDKWLDKVKYQLTPSPFD